LLQLTGCGPKARPAAAGCYAQTTSNKSADHYWQFSAIYLGNRGAQFVHEVSDRCFTPIFSIKP
jgi:hypothetical protein